MHPYLKDRTIFVGPASLPGKLFEIQHYPGAIPASSPSDGCVYGEIYRLLHPSKSLAVLDEYEECSARFPKPHEYERVASTVNLADGKRITAWVYWYRRSTAGLRQIISGDYFDDSFTPDIRNKLK